MSQREAIVNWFRRVWTEEDESAIDTYFVGEGLAFGLSERPMQGPPDFKPFHRALCAQLTGFRFTIDDYVESKDRIWAICHLDAVTRDAAARPVTLRGFLTATCRDGRIVEAYNLWDFLDLYAQMGQLPRDAFALGLAGKLGAARAGGPAA